MSVVQESTRHAHLFNVDRTPIKLPALKSFLKYSAPTLFVTVSQDVYGRIYAVPFSHLFTELQISAIQ